VRMLNSGGVEWQNPAGKLEFFVIATNQRNPSIKAWDRTETKKDQLLVE